MSKIRITTLAVLVLATAFSGYAAISGQAFPGFEPAAAQAFDHSQCQYPDRTTNPADGCDNSDPCDPENTKGGSGDCETTPEEIEQLCAGGAGRCEDKTEADLPDPDRNYYDGKGNLYDYQGTLIEAAPTGGRAKSSCQQ